MRKRTGFRLLALFSLLIFCALLFSTSSLDTVTSAVSRLCSELMSLLPLASMLMVICGAITYALGQMMGAETRARANTWATAMLIGAVIGILITTVAPGILGLIYGKDISCSAPSSSCANLDCTGSVSSATCCPAGQYWCPSAGSNGMCKNSNASCQACTVGSVSIDNIWSALSSLCSNLVSLLPVAAMLMAGLSAVVYSIGQMMGAETRARATVWATTALAGAVIAVLMVAIAPPFLQTIYGKGPINCIAVGSGSCASTNKDCSGTPVGECCILTTYWCPKVAHCQAFNANCPKC